MGQVAAINARRDELTLAAAAAVVRFRRLPSRDSLSPSAVSERLVSLCRLLWIEAEGAAAAAAAAAEERDRQAEVGIECLIRSKPSRQNSSTMRCIGTTGQAR